MPLNDRGEWISYQCNEHNHKRCLGEFDDGGGRTKYCDCHCHRKEKEKDQK